ncbi:MAG: hypothetical protein ACKO96_09525 [Flammeovirgaceae bacterium]
MLAIWRVTLKALNSQVAKEGKCVELPYVGKFIQQRGQVFYMPALDLLSSAKLKFTENEENISPLSKAAIKFSSSQIGADLLSLTAISHALNLTREIAV